MGRKKIITKPKPKPKIYKKIARAQGVRDVLPKEHKYWDLILNKAQDLAKIYGFENIRTPILEPSQLSERVFGKKSTMFENLFEADAKNKVTLRGELRSGIIRAFLDSNMIELERPVKFFGVDSVFRNEKIKQGHYKQFTQCNFEILNEGDASVDVLLILIAYSFFRELQIDVQVNINSIGCYECQDEYKSKLSKFYKTHSKKSKLCSNCQKNLTKDPLSILNCQEESCQNESKDAPPTVDSICEECQAHLTKVLEYLDDLGITYHLDPHLINNADYYEQTVFKILLKNDDEEATKKDIDLGSGGRYDNLLAKLGGANIPGCGLSIGIERVILKIKEKNIPFKKEGDNCIFIAQLGDPAKRQAFLLFEEMRKLGFKIRQSFITNSLRKQLDEATRIGAKYALILGHKEILDKTILLRDMESGNQEVLGFKKVIQEMHKRVGEM